jgi:hypothetical protein
MRPVTLLSSRWKSLLRMGCDSLEEPEFLLRRVEVLAEHLDERRQVAPKCLALQGGTIDARVREQPEAKLEGRNGRGRPFERRETHGLDDAR